VFLRDYIANMVEEAIVCRKQLETLFIETFYRYRDEFEAFVDRYGLYANYEYKAPKIDISFIFNEIMKAYFSEK